MQNNLDKLEKQAELCYKKIFLFSRDFLGLKIYIEIKKARDVTDKQ